MTNKLTLLFGMATSAAMVSCYPPVKEETVRNVPPPIEEEVKPEDATDEGLDELALKEQEALRRQNGIETIGETTPVLDREIPGPREITPKLPEPKVPDVAPGQPKSFPYASSVPGRKGFVFNPYTQAKVDVRGIASGTLVSDPRNPDQKFYVP